MPHPTKFPITTQKQIRAAFWETHPNLSRKRTRAFGKELEYCTDTRCAFVDYVDLLRRNGEISEALAQRATL